MPGLYIGIDTSNYKTSVAVTDSDRNIIYEKSELLDVPQGKRGVRQSEAFFTHSCRLPGYIADMCANIDVSQVKSIGVSSAPRRVEGSYMPCFLAGLNLAEELGSVMSIPIYRFSHQEGHIAAILSEPGFPLSEGENFIFFHLSGGTTEFLKCSPDERGYKTEIIGGTLDISIGQLLDRTGVALGYKFPAGKYLDETCCGCTRITSLPDVRLNDGWFNLSGTETKILRQLPDADDDETSGIIGGLFEMITRLLFTSACQLSRKEGGLPVVISGGVASSSYIRTRIKGMNAEGNTKILFGDSRLSGDNAVGTASLACRMENYGE